MPIRTTARAFQKDLEVFLKDTEKNIGRVRKKVTLDLQRKVSERTPVDTGRARFSWFVTDGAPSREAPPDGTYAGVAPPQATFAQPFEISYITNNLPYIVRLEFGHSGQAPSGMARIAVAEVEAELAVKRPLP